jgi:serine/threonine-protein kinase RsbW
MQVVSAVGEAFNNVVRHGYGRRRRQGVELRIHTRPGHIRIDVLDWGESFDPKEVPKPEFATLPESGLGLYIMQSFMTMAYRPGRPNLLTLRKRYIERAGARRSQSAT